uniref:Uncharacterized protein n=1 Tax=Anopheles merus TaxID=30066 RepID=A0A182V8F9_ANOME
MALRNVRALTSSFRFRCDIQRHRQRKELAFHLLKMKHLARTKKLRHACPYYFRNPKGMRGISPLKGAVTILVQAALLRQKISDNDRVPDLSNLLPTGGGGVQVEEPVVQW